MPYRTGRGGPGSIGARLVGRAPIFVPRLFVPRPRSALRPRLIPDPAGSGSLLPDVPPDPVSLLSGLWAGATTARPVASGDDRCLLGVSPGPSRFPGGGAVR
ncbi:hypothetical protein Pen02_24960 [Plantactinospora endophytica]|uniref:Uncharacterized protein n=1 Tax=Plantactinospora endophytica TaxID=673535 RepID=A0ABQ4DYN5_9ACTN|nr:hypothetical protein Pen02_24960 [Plantactinospora endophytica]